VIAVIFEVWPQLENYVAQALGREKMLQDYRLRAAEGARDYVVRECDPAPAAHGG
jgi:hypothetical protein